MTEKFDLEIGGCGECGSPWVRRRNDTDPDLVEHLYYDRDRKIYGAYKELKGG